MRNPLALASIALAAWFVTIRPPLDAQVRPVYDTGAAGLTHLLGRLQTTASVLHTGAHPDDEDSAFIARSARGDHARVAYLSLTRGEGGQNVIGPELFETLGVIRTEELLQARRLDGGEQFFTRAFDYGFSKTLTEAASRWDEREVLGDMVRVIRTFRPLVIYSRFSGTPSDGHGQHQFAGYLTPRAFEAAADPTQYPEQIAEGLRPWQVRKLYRRAGSDRDAQNAATMRVQTGVMDPVIGRSYAAIAAEGRSQHRSQEMGGIEPLGPSASGLRLVSSRVPAPQMERSVFDALDTSISGLASLAGLPRGTLDAELKAVGDAARQALRAYNPLAPEQLLPALTTGLRATRTAREALRSTRGTEEARAEADFLLATKETDFIEALTRAAGIVVDPLADEEATVAGGALGVTVRTFLDHPDLVTVTGASLHTPSGWRISALATDTGGPSREAPASTTRFTVAVPSDAPLNQPYFLLRPRRGDLYQWPATSTRGRAFDAPLLSAEVGVSIGRDSFTVSKPVQYRVGDRIRGELRRDPAVVPEVTVGLDSNLLVVPTGGEAALQRLVVSATSHVNTPLTGTLRLRLPAGWVSTPASAPFSVQTIGDMTSATFIVAPPSQREPGTFAISAEAEVGGRTFSRDMETVAYPHIQSHRLYRPAEATAQVFDLSVAPARVGYVMGSGDEVPDALRRMGVSVSMIDPATLATGDLARFDTIVVGVRASEARPDFVANQGRLRAYMEGGGTLIVQYQQTDYIQRGMPPYPVEEAGNSRVTDEAAPVRILAPDHPAFTFPNRIVAADFDGWVQERNLYAFPAFDPRYLPLLESADPGEPAQRGGQLYAEVGKGRYVYTSYAWFRQLRAGVPGAYRQFANLVSLSKAP